MGPPRFDAGTSALVPALGAAMSAYRGPGRYISGIDDNEEVRVLGLARVGGLASHYVLCEEQDVDGDGVGFFAERIDVFNGMTMNDEPAYEYIGPLEET